MLSSPDNGTWSISSSHTSWHIFPSYEASLFSKLSRDIHTQNIQRNSETSMITLIREVFYKKIFKMVPHLNIKTLLPFKGSKCCGHLGTLCYDFFLSKGKTTWGGSQIKLHWSLLILATFTTKVKECKEIYKDLKIWSRNIFSLKITQFDRRNSSDCFDVN